MSPHGALKSKLPENRKNIANILGNPSSRKDAETLQKWFSMMLTKVNTDDSLHSSDKLKQKNIIYNAAFSEVAR
jgi:hypothetical protein